MDGTRLPPVMEEVGEPAEESYNERLEKPEVEELTAVETKVEVEEQKTGGQESEELMSDEQELEELRSQVIQLLIELEETRELSQRHEEGFLELQGLLEDERMASAHQAETFTKQIQRLQAQLRSVQEEIDSLEEEKESELSEAQEELRVAQEEVLVLQQAAEEAAAERENDIASLQEELCRLRAELQRLHATRQEYELEITSLRAEIRMKSQGSAHDREEGEPLQGEVRMLRDECWSLKEESQSLKEDNKQLLRKLQHLSQNRESTNDLYLALKEGTLSSEGEKSSTGKKNLSGGTEEEGYEVGRAGSYMTLAESTSNCRLVDASVQKNISFDGKPMTPTGGLNGGSFSSGFSEVASLRQQLKQAEEKALCVQHEVYASTCAGLMAELRELQGRYSTSQKERAELERELQKCREEMQQLTGKNAKNSPTPEPPVLSIPLIGMIVIVALLWCWWAESSF
ncbi:coiled-coil domain-containing protein 136-like isoform X1 [Acipenser ruthenus]|uniref:coiled-coil domain-containing protein 136-like isoform X1 n=1 Tax=Acipenser ruthenus TaxID=7906 RepID=UPI00145BBFCC|nr:coiled-coil domain-containing protein 136-like isoform X1 [Acipenser ruthenus]